MYNSQLCFVSFWHRCILLFLQSRQMLHMCLHWPRKSCLLPCTTLTLTNVTWKPSSKVLLYCFPVQTGLFTIVVNCRPPAWKHDNHYERYCSCFCCLCLAIQFIYNFLQSVDASCGNKLDLLSQLLCQKLSWCKRYWMQGCQLLGSCCSTLQSTWNAVMLCSGKKYYCHEKKYRSWQLCEWAVLYCEED